MDLNKIINEENYEYSSFYQLISVSTHSGTSSSSGHYTARCLTDNNTYYYFSDKNVIQIDRQYLFTDEPYILFYKRIEDQTLINSLERNKKEIIKKDEINQNNSEKEGIDNNNNKRIN